MPTDSKQAARRLRAPLYQLDRIDEEAAVRKVGSHARVGRLAHSEPADAPILDQRPGIPRPTEGDTRASGSPVPYPVAPGAQPIGGRVTITIEDAPAAPEIHLRNMRRDMSWRVIMTPTETIGTWTATLQMPDEPTMIGYHFHFVDGSPILYDWRQEEGQTRAVYGKWVRQPFQIAVYDPAAMPADWTRGMVMYQIFPDRFADGDTASNTFSKGVYGQESVFLKWGDRPELPARGRDFFGGDLQGVIDHLDYLDELGIDCIYMTPIFEAPSNHRYEASDFMKIDPMLGDDATFDRLVEGIHDRGMTLVLDGVFNHCSADSVYFKGAMASPDSEYYRWFHFDAHPTGHRGWYGFGFMPEFTESPEMEAFFLGENGVTAHWLQRGVDGWRLDVAPENSDDFWRRFRKRVDATKPGAYTVSEYWGDSSWYLLGDMFSSTMNYRFGWGVRGFLGLDALTPSELDDRLAVLRRDTPPGALLSQMNLLASHDTNRLLTITGGDRRKVKQMLAFQLSYPGAPLIYYGDETALEGENAEDGRRTMPWDHLDQDMLGYFRHAINSRRDLEPLRLGSFEALVVDDDARTYAFARRLEGGEVVYAAFNASDNAAQAAIPLDIGARAEGWRDVLAGSSVTVSSSGLIVQLEARGAAWVARG